MSIEGQLDIFDALDEKPAQPPFKVSLSVWQELNCGWCGTNGTIGGFSMRHPEHEEISIHGEYCTRCEAKNGSPRIGTVELIINTDPKPGRHGGHEDSIRERIKQWQEIK